MVGKQFGRIRLWFSLNLHFAEMLALAPKSARGFPKYGYARCKCQEDTNRLLNMHLTLKIGTGTTSPLCPLRLVLVFPFVGFR
jgi:hypothetical protein